MTATITLVVDAKDEGDVARLAMVAFQAVGASRWSADLYPFDLDDIERAFTNDVTPLFPGVSH